MVWIGMKEPPKKRLFHISEKIIIFASKQPLPS